MSAVKPIHGAPKPVNVPTDMRNEPPVPCAFKVGDRMVVTNGNGVEFEKTVRGFAAVPHGDRFVYVYTDCWWFPVSPKRLRHATGSAA